MAGRLPGKKTVWAIGERIHSHLADTSLLQGENFILPNSIKAITPLVGQILIEMEKQREKGEVEQIYLFHNRPKTGAIYTLVSQRLLPLDEMWRRDLAAISWPTGNFPEVMNDIRGAGGAYEAKGQEIIPIPNKLIKLMHEHHSDWLNR